MQHIQYMTDSNDHALAPFTSLMRTFSGRPGESPRQFVAEGRILVESLARHGVQFDSVLISKVHEPLIGKELAFVKTAVWLVAPPAMLHEVAGFQFHGGMLAIGSRPPQAELRTIVSGHLDQSVGIVVCASLRNQDNVGLIIRSAFAFGMSAVMMTDDSGDPHSRRCLRVSMGASLFMPMISTADITGDLVDLRESGFSIFGANSSPKSRPFDTFHRCRRFVIVLGNESEGLSTEIQKQCTEQVLIPMVPSQDSLNVAVAGGILMQYFTSPSRKGAP